MTRINIVPVQTLMDKHLLAEYKEITRPLNKVIRRIENHNLVYTSPDFYTLGTGHESFFFDKLKYLFDRYEQLKIEILNRDFNIDLDKYDLIRKSLYLRLSDTKFWNDYNPTPEEMYLNMARLVKRCNLEIIKKEVDSNN